MPISFNTLLRSVGIDPAEVVLLRHRDARLGVSRPPYLLWRDDRAAFEDYQRHQGINNRARLRARYWASFLGTPDRQTLFAGIYRVVGSKVGESDWLAPHTGKVEAAGGQDVYELERTAHLSDLDGLLYIEWGPGTRMWTQRAAKRDKPVLELRRERKEPLFPGYGAFMAQLSELETLSPSWITALGASRGVYLLSCPRTNEQYVGSAYGDGGFIARWLEYARTGHGGNVALKSRDASDYRVSILEVAGSAASHEDVLQMEMRWKQKLQSREMGLNRN